ncbi:methylosome protein 50-like [Fopius arisanus]|uniref:Methylosome protein 50-like n=1 Tax=Fopius arisanus TaxID=64838 RepID=A0A0C9RBX1_9HYME|nr:PREDICTED: methylosome protein 50-like [Fopius arisanus]
MEKDDYLTKPNSNAEIYRNMTVGERASVLDKHLQFIAVYNDKKAILGGSNLTDRYWTGTIWYFDDAADGELERNKSFTATQTESTLSDAAFIEEYKFVVAEDGGIVKVLCVVQPPETWAVALQCVGYTCKHDDSVTSLSVFEDKNYFVSGGMDRCLKVWETSTLMVEYTYQLAHTAIITSVDVLSKSNSVFMSTSLDSEAVLWDVRTPKPARRLYKNDDGNGLTAVACNPLKEHEVAIGGEDGYVFLGDTRKPEELVYKSLEFPRAIHRLKYHHKRNNWLAGCCNDTMVKVLDTSQELSVLFKDANSHTDMVRGLAWCKDELLTCSWDSTVQRHSLTLDN